MQAAIPLVLSTDSFPEPDRFDALARPRLGRIKTARIRAVLDGIEQQLTDPELNAATLGARLGLSERYVYYLLAGAGRSFSQLVRRKRLERACQMLEAITARPRRIVDIAYAVGFADLSNFNRAFRRHFGCTPSDIRRRRRR